MRGHWRRGTRGQAYLGCCSACCGCTAAVPAGLPLLPCCCGCGCGGCRPAVAAAALAAAAFAAATPAMATATELFTVFTSACSEACAAASDCRRACSAPTMPFTWSSTPASRCDSAASALGGSASGRSAAGRGSKG